MRGGEGRYVLELVEGDAADERQRPREPLAEGHRPPARDLCVDAVVARRSRRRRLPARDRDRAHDLVVVDQERDLAVEQDLGALADAQAHGTGRAAVASRAFVRRPADPSGRAAPTSGRRGWRSGSRARSGRRRRLGAGSRARSGGAGASSRRHPAPAASARGGAGRARSASAGSGSDRVAGRDAREAGGDDAAVHQELHPLRPSSPVSVRTSCESRASRLPGSLPDAKRSLRSTVASPSATVTLQHPSARRHVAAEAACRPRPASARRSAAAPHRVGLRRGGRRGRAARPGGNTRQTRCCAGTAGAAPTVAHAAALTSSAPRSLRVDFLQGRACLTYLLSRRWLSECEHERLNAGGEEGDLEGAVGDPARLADQLVEPLLRSTVPLPSRRRRGRVRRPVALRRSGSGTAPTPLALRGPRTSARRGRGSGTRSARSASFSTLARRPTVQSPASAHSLSSS